MVSGNSAVRSDSSSRERPAFGRGFCGVDLSEQIGARHVPAGEFGGPIPDVARSSAQQGAEVVLHVAGEVEDQRPAYVRDPRHLAPQVALVGVGFDLPAERPEVALQDGAEAGQQQPGKVSVRLRHERSGGPGVGRRETDGRRLSRSNPGTGYGREPPRGTRIGGVGDPARRAAMIAVPGTPWSCTTREG